jgi:short-subunit dehydrogenase
VADASAVRPLALVTGASGGIGEAYARRLAATHDVVLVARNRERLEAVSSGLQSLHPAGAFTVCVADLADASGPQVVVDHLIASGREVDLLINNAGVGSHGSFVTADPSVAQTQIQLNCATLVALTQALLPPMLSHGHGGIINVASAAAFQPTPSMAVYGASKAFVLSFTEALAVEVRGSGVRVLAVCPGATETGFFAAAGSSFLTKGRQTPEQVVDESMTAFHAKKTVVVTGLANKLKAQGYRFVPRALLARGSARIVRGRD